MSVGLLLTANAVPCGAPLVLEEGFAAWPCWKTAMPAMLQNSSGQMQKTHENRNLNHQSTIAWTLFPDGVSYIDSVSPLSWTDWNRVKRWNGECLPWDGNYKILAPCPLNKHSTQMSWIHFGVVCPVSIGLKYCLAISYLSPKIYDSWGFFSGINCRHAKGLQFVYGASIGSKQIHTNWCKLPGKGTFATAEQCWNEPVYMKSWLVYGDPYPAFFVCIFINGYQSIMVCKQKLQLLSTMAILAIMQICSRCKRVLTGNI